MRLFNLKRLFAFSILFGFTSMNSLYATNSLIREIQENVFTPSNISIGANNSFIFYPKESSLSNPAFLGVYKRSGGGAGGLFLDNLWGFWGNVHIPSNIGTLGLNVFYVRDDQSIGITDYFNLSVSYSRQITKSLSLGMHLKPSFGNSQNDLVFGLGIEPGLTYRSSWELKHSSGFGLYEPSFFLAVRNLSIQFDDDEDISPSISIHTGFQTAFFRKYDFSSILNIETNAKGDFKSYPFLIGTKLQYKIFHLGFGYMLSNRNLIFDGFSLGGGFNIDLKQGDLMFYYSTVFTNEENIGNFHSFSVNLSYGFIDKKPPQVDIKQNTQVFSPNLDGKLDYIHLDIDVIDESPIKEWYLEIKNSKGKTVRIF